MNKNIIELLIALGAFIIAFLLIFIGAFILGYQTQRGVYNELLEEGYVVRFIGGWENRCEILINYPDGQEWETCSLSNKNSGMLRIYGERTIN